MVMVEHGDLAVGERPSPDPDVQPSDIVRAPDTRGKFLRELWEDRTTLALTLGLPVMLYLSEIGQNTLSIDEEVQMFDQDIARQWLVQGRWGMAALTLLAPQVHNSAPIPLLIFCMGLGLSALILARLVAADALSVRIFVAVYVCTPVWPYLAEFNTLNWGVGVALPLVALAARLTLREGARAIAASIIALAFGLAVYQPLVFVYAVALVFGALWHPGHERIVDSFLAVIRRASFIGLLAGGVYAALSRLLLWIAGEHLQYVQQYFHVSLYVDRSTWRYAVASALRDVIRLVLGFDEIYLSMGFLVLLPFWVAVGMLCLSWLQSSRRTITWLVDLAAISVAGMIAVSPVLLSVGASPTRTLLGVPPFLAGVIAVGARRSKVTGIPVVTCLVMSLASCVLTSQLFALDRWARYADAVTTAQLVERISALTVPNRETTLTVIGGLNRPPTPPVGQVDTFGGTPFDWDVNDSRAASRRAVAMLRLGGLSGLRPAAWETLPDRHFLESMPTWPAPGSVSLVNGTVVIKFGEVDVGAFSQGLWPRRGF